MKEMEILNSNKSRKEEVVNKKISKRNSLKKLHFKLMFGFQTSQKTIIKDKDNMWINKNNLKKQNIRVNSRETNR